MHNVPDQTASTAAGNRKKRTTVLALGAVVIGMFAFGFVIAPLYKLICEITGIQTVAASVRQPVANLPAVINDERQVTVKFDTTVSAGLPWKFTSQERSVVVQPGRINQAKFLAHNMAEEPVIGQAIPSIVPWQAAGYFTKTECFCFSKQELGPGESKEMTVQFMVSPDLPASISTLTLSYTFMNLDSEAAKKIRDSAVGDVTDVMGPG